MAMDVEVQRLQIGDVVMVAPPGEEAKAEATVTRPIRRTNSTVRVALRVMQQKWRRRESNPRPRTHRIERLQA